ncbi:hypothetical protein [Candidatus Binatus sp.]|uniref:hypothetical protein n=1 Tax=Candidatus Binatus sp. TaxID=2811406 RepID=UPI003CC6042C
MAFLRMRRVAQWLKFLDQLLVPAAALLGRGKLECESRGLKANDTRVVAIEMLEESRAQVFSLADVNPESVEQAVNAGGFGRVFQNAFALKQVAAVTRFREGVSRSATPSAFTSGSNWKNDGFI